VAGDHARAFEAGQATRADVRGVTVWRVYAFDRAHRAERPGARRTLE